MNLQKMNYVNNYDNISLSPKKTIQGLDVVIFEKYIGGKIIMLEVVHKKYKGWLSLKTAYRQNSSKGFSSASLVE
jgi:hypothetical protein